MEHSGSSIQCQCSHHCCSIAGGGPGLIAALLHEQQKGDKSEWYAQCIMHSASPAPAQNLTVIVTCAFKTKLLHAAQKCQSSSQISRLLMPFRTESMTSPAFAGGGTCKASLSEYTCQPSGRQNS